MPLQIRRGTTVQRLSITPLPGEPIYDIDLQTVFIGDGNTPGGVSAISGITVEDAQDAVGQMFLDGSHKNIIFRYDSLQDSANRIDVELDLSDYDGEISASSFRGSLFADDSGLIIDAVNKTISASAIDGDLTGSVFGDNSSILVDAVNNTINLDGTVKGDIIPDQNETYDIGSNINRFRDLYLSGSSLYLGSAQITSTNSSINLPAGSTVGGVTIGTGSGGGGGTEEFVFKISADDSTQVSISNGNTVQFVGGLNIETSVDADGVVTIRTDSTNLNADVITTGILTSEDSSQIVVQVPISMNTICTVEDDLIVLGDSIVSGRVSADTIDTNNLTVNGTFSSIDISVINSISASSLSGSVITNNINSEDSSEITIIPSVRMTTICTVDDDLIVLGDSIVSGRVSADTIDTNNLTVNGTLSTNNINANSINSDIITNLITSDDSSEITVIPELRLNSNLIVENQIFCNTQINSPLISTDKITSLINLTIDAESFFERPVRFEDNLEINGEIEIFSVENGLFPLTISHNYEGDVSSSIRIRKSRGSEDFPTVVQNLDQLGEIGFNAYDGNDYVRSATISAQVTGSVTTGIVPSTIRVFTTDTLGNLSERATFNQFGGFELYAYASLTNTLTLHTYHNTVNNSSNFNLIRARGTRVAPSALQDGDDIYDIVFQGYDGTAFRPAAQIRVMVDGTVNTGEVPGRLEFFAADEDGLLQNRVTIDSEKTTFNNMPVLPTYADETAADAAVGGSPVDGMMYYDSGASKIKARAGGAWVALH